MNTEGMRNKSIHILILLGLSFIPLLHAQNIHEAAWQGDFNTVRMLVEKDPGLLNAEGPWG